MRASLRGYRSAHQVCLTAGTQIRPHNWGLCERSRRAAAHVEAMLHAYSRVLSHSVILSPGGGASFRGARQRAFARVSYCARRADVASAAFCAARLAAQHVVPRVRFFLWDDMRGAGRQ